MNIEREARRDAKEFARAQMFYGPGAGNRRKLIQASVDAKAHRSPAYGRAFHAELAAQDMAKHATKARFERDRIDVSRSLGRNIRGLLTGDYRGVSNGVLMIAAAGYLAHKSGLDQRVYEDLRGRIRSYKERRRLRKNFPNITLLK